MLTISSVVHKPSSTKLHPILNSNKNSKHPIQFLKFKSNFFGGSVLRKKMNGIELIKVSALKNEEQQDESSSLLQEKAMVNVVNQLEAIINRLSKWLVSGLFGALILWRHDPEVVWIVMGSVLNSLLSVVLKRIFNQERPVGNLKSDPGMPSSHAQSFFYIFFCFIFSFVEWLGINELSLTLSGITLAVASYLSWLRVSQRLHTVSQVVVGAIFGATFSILWYLSWTGIVHKAFDSFLGVRVVVCLGAAGFCVGFLLYVIRNWFRDD